MARFEHLNVLAPRSFQRELTRRNFIQIGSAAGAGLFLSACGGGSGGSDSGASSDGGSAAGAAQASGDWSRVINPSSGNLSMYTWGDYNDPDLIGAQAEDELGVTMKVDYYSSNEDLIAKLEGSAGTSGFDIVVPTGPYIPQMVQKNLLQKLDQALIPNIANVDPLYLNRDWDPNNEYGICKNWGSTGWMYNKTVVTSEVATWTDFINVCMTEASGNCSVLDSPPNLTGMYFWANGINWTTEETADLDACEAFLVDEFATHIKAFDSYPSTKIAEGAYAASMVWNGDARQAFVRVADAGGNPDDWVWGLGAPATEIWMDLYAIPVGAPNPEAAHSWINWLLIPENSIKDLNYHGYNSGIKNIGAVIEELYPDLADADMIFFTDEQVATMQTGSVNSAQDRQVDIYNKVKAAAGA
jgi:spermidine/putrescine transport system substrate-binding protein